VNMISRLVDLFCSVETILTDVDERMKLTSACQLSFVMSVCVSKGGNGLVQLQ